MCKLPPPKVGTFLRILACQVPLLQKVCLEEPKVDVATNTMILENHEEISLMDDDDDDEDEAPHDQLRSNALPDLRGDV